MIAQSLRQMKVTAVNCHEPAQHVEETEKFLVRIRENINILHARSRQGLWHIAAFLFLSIGALLVRDISILDRFPENARIILGMPPTPFLIHIVLAVSTISALIIIGGRIANGDEPGRNWEQVGYRGVFYLFYFFSNALGTSFLYVFIAGLTVLAFESYHIWSHCAKAIAHEKALLRKAAMWPMVTLNTREDAGR